MRTRPACPPGHCSRTTPFLPAVGPPRMFAHFVVVGTAAAVTAVAACAPPREPRVLADYADATASAVIELSVGDAPTYDSHIALDMDDEYAVLDEERGIVGRFNDAEMVFTNAVSVCEEAGIDHPGFCYGYPVELHTHGAVAADGGDAAFVIADETAELRVTVVGGLAPRSVTPLGGLAQLRPGDVVDFALEPGAVAVQCGWLPSTSTSGYATRWPTELLADGNARCTVRDDNEREGDIAMRAVFAVTADECTGVAACDIVVTTNIAAPATLVP